MLQRMRELAVQSANGIYTSNDRKSIQTEMDQLSEEIARISETTEFNTMTLLDGSIDHKSYTSDNKVSLVYLSDSVAVGDYKIKITQDARQALIEGNITNFSVEGEITETRKIASNETGSININGESVTVNEGDTIAEVFEKLRDTCDILGVDVFAVEDPKRGEYDSKQLSSGDTLVFVSRDYGSQEEIKINCVGDELSKILGLTDKDFNAKGVDANAEIITDGSLFNDTATVSAKGNKVNITDRNGFNMVFELESGIIETDGQEVEITASVLDAGPMDLQIGANEGQLMRIRIPKVAPKTLGIDKVNIGTAEGHKGLLEYLIQLLTWFQKFVQSLVLIKTV